MKMFTSVSPLSRPSKWLRLLKGIAVISGVLLAILASGILLLMWSCTPPSLEALKSHFPARRPDLETILAMSNHDSQLLRIDPNWLMTKDAQFMSYDPASGITQKRWNEYRWLFAKNGISQGIQREPDSDDAFIMVQSVGLLNRGFSNGYLYCGAKPVHRYPPCLSTSVSGSHVSEGGSDEGFSFIRLEGGWYAVSIG